MLWLSVVFQITHHLLILLSSSYFANNVRTEFIWHSMIRFGMPGAVKAEIGNTTNTQVILDLHEDLSSLTDPARHQLLSPAILQLLLGKSSEYILARKPTNSTGVRRCTRP
jgi:hypothetical protein